MSPPFIIAIDGPSASGKGTLARKLASLLDFAHLDTGLLYRATGLAVLRAGGDPLDREMAEEAARALAQALTDPASQADFQGVDLRALWQDEALRGDAAGVAASKVAAIDSVRASLLRFQKNFCAAPPEGKRGAVLDGRDIGTVIAPDAKAKIFVTASAETRADRRFKELQMRGIPTLYTEVLADMRARDARDSERAIAPTKPAPDAFLLDTTALDAAQALEAAYAFVQKKLWL